MNERLPRYKIFDQEQLESLHEATMRVLQNTGLKIHGSEALSILGEAGCTVHTGENIVKFPRHLVEEAISSAPSRVFLAAKDPKHDLVVGEDKTCFTTYGTGVKIIDPATGMIRNTTKADLGNVTRVCDALDEVDFCVPAVMPRDVPVQSAELHQADAVLSNTSKHFAAGPAGRNDARALFEIAAAIVGGMNKLKERPIISTITCPVSPLQLHDCNTEVILESAKNGIPLIFINQPLAGGTAPTTLAGTIVMINAEILGAITLAQLVNKGTPVIYGSTSTMLDLRHVVSALGSPELGLISSAVAELGYYYKIPTQVGGSLSDSKIIDAQTGHEKTITSLLPALLQPDIIFGMGFIEMGLTFSFTQLLIDAEFIKMLKRTTRGITINQDTLAVDIIHQVGPGKDFLAQKHTRKHMKNEQSAVELIDRNRRETWERLKHKDIADRAHEKAAVLLETHRPLELDSEVKKLIAGKIADAENL